MLGRSADDSADGRLGRRSVLTAQTVSTVDSRPPSCVHIDLDGARHIYRVHGWHFRSEHDLLFESGLHAALELLADVGVKATLFTIAEDLDDPDKKRLIRLAVDQGHEIASHTVTHRLLTRLSTSEQREEIHTSRIRLEEELGTSVVGFRAPAFDLDAAVLAQVSEAGYRWDSSLFSSASAGRGLEQVPLAPHLLRAQSPLLELPLPSYASLPLPFHPSYAFVTGLWYFRWGLRRFRRTEAPFVLLFHLTEFSDPLERHVLGGLRPRLFTLSHLSARTKRRWAGDVLEEVGQEYRIVCTDSLLDEAFSRPGRDRTEPLTVV